MPAAREPERCGLESVIGSGLTLPAVTDAVGSSECLEVDLVLSFAAESGMDGSGSSGGGDDAPCPFATASGVVPFTLPVVVAVPVMVVVPLAVTPVVAVVAVGGDSTPKLKTRVAKLLRRLESASVGSFGVAIKLCARSVTSRRIIN